MSDLNIRPPVETASALPLDGNEEDDARLCEDTLEMYCFRNGKWEPPSESIVHEEVTEHIPEIDLRIKSTPVEPKRRRMVPRAWMDVGTLRQVMWPEYGGRYGAAFSIAHHLRETAPDMRENPHVEGSPDYRGWEDGWHFEERGLPEWRSESEPDLRENLENYIKSGKEYLGLSGLNEDGQNGYRMAMDDIKDHLDLPEDTRAAQENVWELMEKMVEQGAVHKTKRFALDKVDISFIASHLLEEAEEFVQSVREGEPDVDELSDVFGCLIHACISLEVTPEVLQERLIYKLYERFEDAHIHKLMEMVKDIPGVDPRFTDLLRPIIAHQYTPEIVVRNMREFMENVNLDDESNARVQAFIDSVLKGTKDEGESNETR